MFYIDFHMQVKKVLSTDRYKMFSKALVEYKRLGDFDKLTPVLVGLFTEDSQFYSLFRGKMTLLFGINYVMNCSSFGT